MSHDHLHRRARSADAAAAAPAPHAGKHTLTGQLAPVQLRAAGEPTDDVHAAAARGVASPATALPYAEKIQQLFGRDHDVSRIKAHVGGDSAAAMGARGFATGDHVVFDQPPDLHTAAHEAAHVVQQAGGVHLAGGVGQAGDDYEQHADAVADRVVAGQSAADLLGPPRSAGGGGAAVQRKPEKPTAQQSKTFCKADWLKCGKDGDHQPEVLLQVRKMPPIRAMGPGGRTKILVESPKDLRSPGPYVYFYLIRSDGTPIRGGAGLLYASSSKPEQDIEVDTVAADAIGPDTRALVVEDSIDLHGKTRVPKQPVAVLEVSRLGAGVQVRLDVGQDEGAAGLEHAKVKFAGADGAPDLEFEASVVGLRQYGGSYVDFVIQDPGAAQVIGNLQDAIRRKAAFATFTDPRQPPKK